MSYGGDRGTDLVLGACELEQMDGPGARRRQRLTGQQSRAQAGSLGEATEPMGDGRDRQGDPDESFPGLKGRFHGASLPPSSPARVPHVHRTQMVRMNLP